MSRPSSCFSTLFLCLLIFAGCREQETPKSPTIGEPKASPSDTADYFLLRPKVEKDFGYSHAVRIGNEIKISGAVSMDDNGVPTATGNLDQQMKNCYSDLDKILKHYGCTFDDVVVENIFTTNMAELEKVSSYRSSIYTKHYPVGTWLEVKGLASPAFMIEIELEVHKSH